MTVKLGWKVDLAVEVFGDKLPQEVELTVRRGTRDERLLGSWRGGFADLANAVSHGAMCGANIAPADSRLEVLDIAMVPTGDIRTVFRIAGIDPGAWRTITALAVFFTYGAPSPAVEIAARSTGAKRPAISEKTVWSLPYPGLPKKLPFELDREEDPTSFDILIRIRFRKKLDNKTKLTVLLAMKAWSTLLLGGYPEDGEDMTTCSTSSREAYLIDPRTVEYSAEYRGHIAGLDAAVLMALWFHENGAPVEAVLIE
jgi:hypothetical protein